MTRALSLSALRNAAEANVLGLAMLGDDAAFAELVRRRHSAIRQLLRRLSRDAALADDLAQQVFLQAWRTLRTLKAPGAFNAWLRKLAVNVWLQHVRVKQFVTESIEAHVDAERAEETGAGVQLDLDAALAALTPVVRLCIVLAYNEGMSHGEITDATGLPLGTVKSHINRGVARLRKLLQAYEPALQE